MDPKEQFPNRSRYTDQQYIVDLEIQEIGSEDYINFLRQISGGDSLGLSFQVDNSRKEGFGIYRTEDSGLCFDDMTDKIADTLTDFLVKGVGIDVSITL